MSDRRSGPRGLTHRIAGTYPLADTYHMGALQSEMEEVTALVAELVPTATGLELTGSPSTVVIGRQEWVGRNVASFAHLIEPVRKRLLEMNEASGKPPGSMARIVDRFVKTETEALLSVMARRVLGQYELVLPTGEPGDVVSYVGPNIMQMERANQFRPSEFRFWVALHEMTHRAQFQGIPWLRDYFMGLVTELVEQSRPEPGKLGRIIDEMTQRRRAGTDLVDERGLLGLFATGGQREVIDRVQALMSLLEGHGHVVMDRLGATHLRTQDRMSRMLKARRTDKRTATFFRLTGLEMKLKQYRIGERFVKTVETEAGWETLGLAFRGASSLPTLAEIEEPVAWLERVA